MSFGLRPCILQGWVSCDGNCGNCVITATASTDGFWYHGSGKLGGEFCPNEPNDEERYGEYVKIVRCKDCMHLHDHECPISWGKTDDDYCSFAEQKDEVEE